MDTWIKQWFTHSRGFTTVEHKRRSIFGDGFYLTYRCYHGCIIQQFEADDGEISKLCVQCRSCTANFIKNFRLFHFEELGNKSRGKTQTCGDQPPRLGLTDGHRWLALAGCLKFAVCDDVVDIICKLLGRIYKDHADKAFADWVARSYAHIMWYR